MAAESAGAPGRGKGMDAATVYVIDDEADVRDGLGRLLRSAKFKVEAQASGAAFLGNAPYPDIGCILLDVDMPDMTGPQLHARLGEAGIHLPVIFLTGKCSVSDGVRAMKQGACDFLEKPVDADTLLAAIELAVARSRQRRSDRTRKGDIERRLAALSRRERQVLDLVIAGRLNKQIASELGIAEKTVKVHRGRVMTKMRCPSLAELVHLCDEIGHVGHAGPGGRSGAPDRMKVP